MRKKYAIVTGATGDIGSSITQKLITDGYTVYALGRNEEKACQLFSSYTKDKLIFQKLDVTREDDVLSFFNILRNENISVDCLVTCAGSLALNTIEDLTADTWNHIIQTNLNGTFYFFREAVKIMQSTNTPGTLIAIGSRWGQSGHAHAAAYSASKSALSAFIKSVQYDLIGKGQRAFLISPGSVQGSMSNSVDQKNENMYIKPGSIASLISFINATDPSVLFDEISIKAYPYDYQT